MMTNESLSSEDIYKALALSKSVIQKAIITFILSTSIKKETLVKLKIKDFLEACGRSTDDKNALKKLLEENPLEILPCWVLEDVPKKLIFNSYEASFYLFLYLQSRLPINDYDEPLFAHIRNDKVRAYGAETIMEKISQAAPQNVDFRQTTLINTFENACNNFVLDVETKQLFLGKSERYTTKNEIEAALDNRLFKEKIINEYKKLIPHITAGYFMYEHLDNYTILNADRENYREKIYNYFTNVYSPRFNDYSDVNLGKMPYKAYSIAKKDIENNVYKETPAYYNKILTQAELFVIFKKTETRLGDDAYRNRDFENFNADAPHPRINLLIQCIDDMELDKIKIADMFQWSPEEIRTEVIRQLGLNNCYMGEFSYDLFKKVLFDTIYALLEAYNF